MNIIPILFLAVGASLLTACASSPPKLINAPGVVSVDVATVQQSAESHVGQQVRWGGSIAHITNLKTSTEVEIVSRSLTKGGRPKDGDQTQGRFIVILDGFVDPDVYASDREITVRGPILASRVGKIGEFSYRYPVVRAQAHELWEKRKPIAAYEPFPWLYDPWLYPYAYRPHPFYYRW